MSLMIGDKTVLSPSSHDQLTSATDRLLTHTLSRSCLPTQSTPSPACPQAKKGAGKSTRTTSKSSTSFDLAWADLVDTCRRMDGAPEETYELDMFMTKVPLAYFDWVGKLDDIDLHKVVVEKVKRIGNFIARMNLFALGRLIIAKRNRVVTEEEDREWKMIFKAKSWNKLRSSTHKLS